uniref:phosphoethanolamine N-methyltransferase n=1 Tax=Strongyloides papillosus TaxID=174720 RepID=A0A0N5B4V9_STREA
MSDTCKTEITVPVRPIITDETIELEEFGIFAKKAIDNCMAGELSIEEFVDKMQVRSKNDSFSLIPIQMKDKTFLNVNTDVDVFLTKPKEYQNKEDNSPYNNYYRCKYFGPNPINKNNENVKIINHGQDFFSYEADSINIIFTNRFFIYLNDKDAINFLASCLSWMKEDGYFLFNEPCIHSTDNNNDKKYHESIIAESTSMLQQYPRNILSYLDVIESIRIIDESGTAWQFYIDVSTSSPTYITYGLEWRYLMLRARKYRANTNGIKMWKLNGIEHLMSKISDHIALPSNCYQYAEKSFADKIFSSEIEHYDNKYKDYKLPGQIGSGHFIFQNPKTAWYHRICPFRVLTDYKNVIWCSEPSSHFYEYSIEKANSYGDKKMFFTYSNAHPIDALNAPCSMNYVIKVFMSIDILDNFTLGFNHFLRAIGVESTRIILLESYKTKEEKERKLKII